MNLVDAVETTLDQADAGDGLGDALNVIREHVGVDRLSIHSFDIERRVLTVVAGAGERLLGNGTELPIDVSTTMVVAASGAVHRSDVFDADAEYTRPGDQLVTGMGFRSGCAVPLVIGSKPVGTLAATSRSPNTCGDVLIEAITSVSPSITLALYAARRPERSRILVCHDDALSSEGIARVLEQALAAEVVICASPDDALSRFEHTERRIDTVVCDSLFADGHVHSFLRELRALGVAAPALVLGLHSSPLGHRLALRSGAAGYVPRSEGTAALVEAVRRLRNGQTVGLGDEATGATQAPDEHLTAQESKVLLLLECGLRFKEIAAEMNISVSTAKGYARNVFSKLNVHSRAEAVYEARRQGILDLLRVGAETAPVEATHKYN